ncbi:hypothetical protein [Actinomadura sediminis]|uniref:Uncharacterized protein n=1 Tax=Actinomadura sediminis TaxID=1038904 RepID=A0ABW3EW42_9ACTN
MQFAYAREVKTMSIKAEIKASLETEFPGWRVMQTDRGRWWGLCGPLPADRRKEQDVVEADTPEDLRHKLRQLTSQIGQ